MSPKAQTTVDPATLRAQLAVLETMLGPQEYSRCAERLAEADRALVLAMGTSEARVPASLATRVLTAAAEQTGRELDELRDAVLEYWARENFTGPWGSLTNPSNEETLVARAASRVHRAYDRGEVLSATTDGARCDVLVSAWPAMPEHAMHELRAAYRVILELTGHAAVRVTAGRTPQGALFRISWG